MIELNSASFFNKATSWGGVASSGVEN